MNQKALEKYEITAIGIIRSCFTEKFGIPRQAGLVETSRAWITIFEPFNRPEFVKELDQFSHIWVQFLFHDTVLEGWKSTVRPPGLGGQKRVGVFASRSPHRPNHLGFSAVRLLDIRSNREETVLQVGGGDFLDGTPVIDIKPYIPYCDSIIDAAGGYSGRMDVQPEVSFTKNAEAFCVEYERESGRNLRSLIIEVLANDPRPASQRYKRKKFGVRLWDVNLRWSVNGDKFTVTECRLIQEP